MPTDHSLEVQREELRALNQLIEERLRARGFDPSQLDNVPLTPELEQLRSRRSELQAAIEQRSPHEEEREND